jgi:hypothetical protein
MKTYIPGKSIQGLFVFLFILCGLAAGEFLIAGGAKNQDGAVIASCPEGFMALWQGVDSANYYRIHSGKISLTGEFSELNGFDTAGSPRLGVVRALAAVSDNHYFFGWFEYQKGIMGAGFPQRLNFLQWNGGNFSVVPTAHFNYNQGIAMSGPWATNGRSWAYLTRYVGIGRSSDETVTISFMPVDDINPLKQSQVYGWGAALAYGSGYYLSVNRGKYEDGGRLFAYRYNDSTFGRIDSAMIYDAGTHVLSSPTLAAGSNGFLLVYSEDEGPDHIRLKARLLSGTSALTVGNAFEVTPALVDKREQLVPVAGYNPSTGQYLVVWQQGSPYAGGLETDIYGARIDGQGLLIDSTPLPICAASGSQEKPRLAYKDGKFLVTWNDLRNGRDWDVYGAIVTQDGVAAEKMSTPHSLYALNAVSPNPFNGRASISFYVPSNGDVSLRIYTLQGKLVRTLVNGVVSSGAHTVTLSAKRTSPLPANVYLCRMKAAGFEKTVRLLKLK